MDDDQIRAALAIYREQLLAHGASHPVRSTERPNFNHLLWMCNEIETFLDADRREKAMRWLGFLQGAMWWASVRSVADMYRIEHWL